MFRTLRWAAAVAVLTATGLLGCSSQDPDGIGSPAPDFEAESLQSAAIKTTLAQHRGKVVVLDFWATWCGPCRQISPFIDYLGVTYKAQGLDVLAISNEDRKLVQGFESARPHQNPVILDPNRLAASAFRVESLPTLVIIDRKGIVRFWTAGFSEQTPGQMEAIVKKALAEPG